MNVAISAQNLIKEFGPVTAVKNLSLSINEGAFFGLLGTNGAGKTTAVGMLSGLLQPTSGIVKILGKNFHLHGVEIKRQLGVMTDTLGLYEQLTGEEYLVFIGKVFSIPDRVIFARCEELLELMCLAEARHGFIYRYSAGMKKKLYLASLFIRSPRVLIMDEPFEGIDPASAIVIQEVLLSMQDRGITIFLTSHNLELVEKLCSEVAIMHEGEIIHTAKRDRYPTAGGRVSGLEKVFLELVRHPAQGGNLSWLNAGPSPV